MQPFSTVGFTGSRHLSGRAYTHLQRTVTALAAAGKPLHVGCARGADAAVRSASPHSLLTVHRATTRRPFHLVQRSIRMVNALAAAQSPLLVATPLGEPPKRFTPSSHWQSCGSGSWSTVLLAAGLCIPVILLHSQPPMWWQGWQPLSLHPFAGGYYLPAQTIETLYEQPVLF